MRRRPGHLDFHVARSVLLMVLAVWGVLLSFDLVTAFADDLREVGKGGYTLSHALLEETFSVPRRLYELFPTVAVIGCVLGLGGLASRSELVAMRAVGMSTWRIGLAALAAVFALSLLMMANMELVAPGAHQRSQAVANSAKAVDLIMARRSGLWAREGNVFLNARSGSKKVESLGDVIELEDVRLFEFDGDGRLVSLAHVRQAQHSPDGWILLDLERTRFQDKAVTVEKVASERWKTTLDQRSLAAALAQPRYLTLSELDSNIGYLKRNQLDSAKFESAYWARWIFPLKVLLLCLATLPFAFGPLRTGGFGKRLFVGIVIGIGTLLVEQLLVKLSDVYRVSPLWAYLLLMLALAGFAWGMFRRRA
jgi:lipopolysaccharide export system permease protein